MNLLIILLVLAMIGGIVLGLVIRDVDPGFTDDKRKKMYLKFPGDLLLSMLKMIILPLIFTSLVAGRSALYPKACT